MAFQAARDVHGQLPVSICLVTGALASRTKGAEVRQGADGGDVERETGVVEIQNVRLRTGRGTRGRPVGVNRDEKIRLSFFRQRGACFKGHKVVIGTCVDHVAI